MIRWLAVDSLNWSYQVKSLIVQEED